MSLMNDIKEERLEIQSKVIAALIGTIGNYIAIVL